MLFKIHVTMASRRKSYTTKFIQKNIIAKAKQAFLTVCVIKNCLALVSSFIKNLSILTVLILLNVKYYLMPTLKHTVKRTKQQISIKTITIYPST